MPGKNALGYEAVRATPEVTALRQLVTKLTAHVAALRAQIPAESKPVEAKGEDTDSDTFEVVQPEPVSPVASRKNSDADSEDYCLYDIGDFEHVISDL
jgi:hypothetical protein